VGINVTSVITLASELVVAALALGAQGPNPPKYHWNGGGICGPSFHVGDKDSFRYFDSFVTDVGFKTLNSKTPNRSRLCRKDGWIPNSEIIRTNGLVRTTLVSVELLTQVITIKFVIPWRFLDDIFKIRKDVESHRVISKDLGNYSLQPLVIYKGKYVGNQNWNTMNSWKYSRKLNAFSMQQNWF